MQSLPPPPRSLRCDDVSLRFIRIVPGDPSRGFVPSYHFRIIVEGTHDVGHINLRVGDTEHVRLYAGHIGYEIIEPYRGNRYAYQACCAIAPFVRVLMTDAWITCNPDNIASARTIERLGARFVEEIEVPKENPLYERGILGKRRYLWTP